MCRIATILASAAFLAIQAQSSVAGHPGHSSANKAIAEEPLSAIVVTIDALSGLPVESVSLDDHGTARSCSGPTLASLLAAHGYPQAGTLRGATLAHGIHIVARDGYRVLLSLGEIDPLLGKAQVILATQCDGTPLEPENGPVRLVVADDDRPARAVRQVDRIEPVVTVVD